VVGRGAGRRRGPGRGCGGQCGFLDNDGGPAAAGSRMPRGGRNTDAVYVMGGRKAVAGGVGPLGEPAPVEQRRTAFRGAGLADSSGSAIAATSAAPSPSYDKTDDRPAILSLGGHNRHRRHTATPNLPPPTSTSTATAGNQKTITRRTLRAAAAMCLGCCRRSGWPRPRCAAL